MAITNRVAPRSSVRAVERETARRAIGIGARLALTDTAAIMVAVLTAYLCRFGASDASLRLGAALIDYELVAIGLAAAWAVALWAGRTRDAHVVGAAAQESRTIIDWTLRVFGLLAILAYAVKVDLARSFFVVALTLGLTLLLAERWAWGRWLASERRAGRQVRRVLAVGDADGVADLADRLGEAPQAGYRLVGSCDPQAEGEPAPETAAVSTILLRAAELDVQAVAFLAPDRLEPGAQRRIEWGLRESGIDLIHVPPLASSAGARLWTEVVGGLPLIHAQRPSRSIRDALKAMLDWVVSLLAIALFLVPGLVIAAAIKLTSPGPVFFVQRRIGRNGVAFPMIKFRTMRVGAQDELDTVRDLDDGNGMLFKVKDDPRVTAVGRVLRRYSLDELPQFFNVLARQMSVVGPRPPLPEEVARYSAEALRRLVVLPGITGLWQISGRSDLTWDDSLRLDLLYVDTWNILKDVGICASTVRAVVQGEGAY